MLSHLACLSWSLWLIYSLDVHIILQNPNPKKKLHCECVCVCVCVLTWTVCNLLVGHLLTASSTQVEDTFVSLQRKISWTKQKATNREFPENNIGDGTPLWFLQLYLTKKIITASSFPLYYTNICLTEWGSGMTINSHISCQSSVPNTSLSSVMEWVEHILNCWIKTTHTIT